MTYPFGTTPEEIAEFEEFIACSSESNPDFYADESDVFEPEEMPW
jgi:hypothetical protein